MCFLNKVLGDNLVSLNASSFKCCQHHQLNKSLTQKLSYSLIWDSKYTRLKVRSKPDLIHQNGEQKYA